MAINCARAHPRGVAALRGDGTLTLGRVRRQVDSESIVEAFVQMQMIQEATAFALEHERVAAPQTQEQHRLFVGKEHQQFEHRRVAVNLHATAPPHQQTSATASQHSWAQTHRVELEERLLGSNSAAAARQHIETAYPRARTSIGMHGASNESEANQSQERAKAGWADGHHDMVPKTEPTCQMPVKQDETPRSTGGWCGV